mmetsp:Transcript_1571/g.2774  ORF Transcript_1571/g.2774 Transcript_1571/m.2774 type:complete len:82 (+) Transcript_1571:156-401(+)
MKVVYVDSEGDSVSMFDDNDLMAAYDYAVRFLPDRTLRFLVTQRSGGRMGTKQGGVINLELDLPARKRVAQEEGKSKVEFL